MFLGHSFLFGANLRERLLGIFSQMMDTCYVENRIKMTATEGCGIKSAHWSLLMSLKCTRNGCSFQTVTTSRCNLPYN